ncbi:unnamed protein product [Polarella glacialis]|uniref:CSD domain-containing protein n=1 Tax=Polarella glacialis TaxID=89957 RepID=A0A813JDR7_POLGL|nr:unnamed protein product [Polarella glacialis]CAE8620096.1 unnamed protein product [Polarella glacialis]CAE8678097.1 unnamed protein product [Polarella glacialis]CAE8679621.1 unnamed protein product [Polarella glacialis]
MAQLTGTVKSFNPQKGFGFIECPAAGSDVFFMKSDLNGYGASKGDMMSFSIVQGDKGAKAANVTVMPGADGSQTFIGEVKSYNAMKGFGFLSSIASQQLFGKDVFAMKSQLGDVGVGTQVQFKAAMSERGPVASECQVLGGGMPGMGMMMPGMQQWPGMGMQQWPGMGMQPGMGMPGMGMQKSAKPDEVFFGTMKSVNAEKGWGHISCDATNKIYGKDMFIMKTQLDASGCVAEQTVCFTVTQGPKGPHADNVKAIDGTSSGMTYSGQVKTFNDGKGWGFIDCADTKAIFGSDIFFHRNDVSGAAAQGTQVSFTVDTSNGRATAKNVTPGFGAVATTSATARASPY